MSTHFPSSRESLGAAYILLMSLFIHAHRSGLLLPDIHTLSPQSERSHSTVLPLCFLLLSTRNLPNPHNREPLLLADQEQGPAHLGLDILLQRAQQHGARGVVQLVQRARIEPGVEDEEDDVALGELDPVVRVDGRAALVLRHDVEGFAHEADDVHDVGAGQLGAATRVVEEVVVGVGYVAPVCGEGTGAEERGTDQWSCIPMTRVGRLGELTLACGRRALLVSK